MNYYNSSSSLDDSDNSNEFARVNRVMLPKSSDEYRQRRERNNAAVKKSRFKSKQKTLETQKRVDQLKEENGHLERRVEALSRELNFMRAIFIPQREGSHQGQENSSAQQYPILMPQQQPNPVRQTRLYVVRQDENKMGAANSTADKLN